MKTQKLAILFLAGLLVLPMTFMEAAARPTVINITYSGQARTSEDVTFQLHGFGFPGEELEWSGSLVFPADQESHPSWTSNLVVTSSSYSSTSVEGSFELAESSNPYVNGCPYDFSARINGYFQVLQGAYNPYCLLIEFTDYGATVVINM